MSNCDVFALEWANPIARNSRVQFIDDFDEATGQRLHDYLIDGEKIDKSVTGVIHAYFGDFDAPAIATKITNGKRWASDPDYKYYQMSVEQMCAMWSQSGEEASRLGSKFHLDVEKFYNWLSFIDSLAFVLAYECGLVEEISVDVKMTAFAKEYLGEMVSCGIDPLVALGGISPGTYPPWETLVKFNEVTRTINKYPRHLLDFYVNKTVEFAHFVDFYHDTKDHLEPFRTELIMFSKTHLLAGSIDILFRHKITKNFLIYDWKRSKEFKYTNKFQKGLKCLSHLDDCNVTHYSLQLNMYKKMLESEYGYTVDGLALIRCHPNCVTYDRYDALDMSGDIDAILEDRVRLSGSAVQRPR
jgi:hypothetical protein